MLNRSSSTKPALPTAAMLLCSALLLAGCAGKPVEVGSLYQRLGEEAGIATLVDDLMRNIEQDPRIRESFAKAAVPKLKRALAVEICAIANGPCSPSGDSAQTTLQGLKIDNEQFDAFIGDFAKTLDQHDVGPNTQRELLFPLKAMRGDVIDTGTPG